MEKSMKFLTNWRINLDKVPAYVEFNKEFKEQIDYELANIILNSNDERLTDEIKDEFRKLVVRIDRKTNMLPVKYSPRYKLGRRYPDCPEPLFPNRQPNPAYKKYYSALISQPRLIKNTIFHYQGWVDIDQRKGHPTIIYSVAEKNHIELPAYKSYLLEGNFEKIVNDFEKYYNLEPALSEEQLTTLNESELKEYYDSRIDEKDIKWLFNKTIYGGGHSKWVEDIQKGSWTKDGRNICKRKPKELKNANNPNPFYTDFYQDTQKIINLVYLNNEAIKDIVCKDIDGGEENDWKRKNRVMAYWCGIIENEITFKAYKYLCDNHIIEKGFVDWGLDGLTIPFPNNYNEFEFHLNQMNEYVRKQTGLERICFVRKNFKANELLISCIEERKNLIINADDYTEKITPQEEIKTFEIVAAEFEKNHCKIINKSLFIKELDDEVIMMSKEKIKTSYEHLTYEQIKNDEVFKHVFIYDWLTQNENQRCYDDVGIYPRGIECPANHFNLWRKFPMESITEFEIKNDELQMILNHIKILCGHEEDVYNYFIRWIAQMLQYPAVKTICPTLISKQGAGKGTLLKLLREMLGNSKVFETTTPSRDVWGDFNGRMCNTFLINLNELSKKETIECEGRIKGLITDSKLTINNKGINQYDINSYHRFIATTNGSEPINTSKDDRRNLIIRSSDEKCGDKDYFNKLHQILEDVNVIKTCYEYFMSIEDMDKFNKLEIPQTNYQNNLKELSVSPIEQWLEAFTLENYDKEEVEMLGTETCNVFKDWCKNNGVEYNIDAKKLGVRIANLNIDGIERGKHTNKGWTKKYNIDKLKKHFKIGVLVNIMNKNDLLDKEDYP